jgi:hypothetical protein
MRRRDTQHQTGCRQNSVIRAQNSRSQPPALFGAMSFWLMYRHLGRILDLDRRSTSASTYDRPRPPFSEFEAGG